MSWEHHGNDISQRRNFSLHNKILLVTWNKTFARGEGEQSQLMPHLRFSKSVNYSAVTLGRNSCWQLLRANSDSHFLEGDFLFLVAKKGNYYSTKKGEYLKESSTGSIFIGRNFDDGVARLSSRLIWKHLVFMNHLQAKHVNKWPHLKSKFHLFAAGKCGLNFHKRFNNFTYLHSWFIFCINDKSAK